MMPSPSDLTYFLEVAGTANLSRAAERIGISQPSLTLAIQRLEDSVGVPLLLRSKKGVTLTPAGKQLATHTRHLLQEWESVRSKALDTHEKVTGNITIGAHPSVAMYSLPFFLPELLDSYPDLQIKLIHDHSRKITEQVASMQIELGIVVNPSRHPDLVIKTLCHDEVTLWTGPKAFNTQNSDKQEGVLVCDPDLIQSQELVKKLKRSGLKFKRYLTTSNLEVATSLTAVGAGIGILPGRVATKDKSLKLKKLPKAPFYRDEICVVYRVENRNVRSIQKVIEMISQVFN